jgi:hypothetical protein
MEGLPTRKELTWLEAFRRDVERRKLEMIKSDRDNDARQIQRREE